MKIWKSARRRMPKCALHFPKRKHSTVKIDFLSWDEATKLAVMRAAAKENKSVMRFIKDAVIRFAQRKVINYGYL